MNKVKIKISREKARLDLINNLKLFFKNLGLMLKSFVLIFYYVILVLSHTFILYVDNGKTKGKK